MGDEDTAELEVIIKGLLISNPTVINANRLHREFENEEGRQFPYRKLGYSSFVDYLRSIPKIVKLDSRNPNNPDVIPIASTNSVHIDQLVQRQVVPRKRNNSSRRGGYNGRLGRPPPLRRRPSCPIASSFGSTASRGRPPPFARATPLSSPTPYKQGVYVRDIENHFRETYSREDLARNGIHSGNDLFRHANDMVDRIDDKVYPKMDIVGRNSDKVYSKNTYTPQTSQSNREPVGACALKAIPAGMEDELEDYNLDEIDYEDNDFWENVSEENISNYTIKICTQTADSETNVVSSDKEEEMQEEYSPEDDYCGISEAMINNFRRILAKHQEGIWATELQKIYYDEFHVTLDLQDLGYNSSIQLAASLPSVFTYKRVGSDDWKLYDAQDLYEDIGQDDLSYYDENDKYYVPQAIISNIKQLVEQHSEGFRSTNLLHLYQRTFNKSLDLEALGFERFEDFLEILRKDITLKKVTELPLIYLLLPKPSVVPLDAIQTTAPADVLKISGPLPFMGPDNVVKPGETIPMQELPPLRENAKDREPIMEMGIQVAEVTSPQLFYFCLDSMHNELQSMMNDLDKFYNLEHDNFQILLPHLIEDLVCACRYEDSWHRAKITAIRNDNIYEIEYIDYGTPGKVKRSELRYLQKEFATLPAQAICGKLLGIFPTTAKWPRETCKTFLSLVAEKRLYAYVYNVATKENKFKKELVQLEMLLYNTLHEHKDICINDQLVELGLAEYRNIVKEDPVTTHQSQILETSVAINDSTLQSAQVNTTKRISRPPPGFERREDTQFEVDQTPQLTPTYNSQSSVSTSYLPDYNPQQQQSKQEQLQINNYYHLVMPKDILYQNAFQQQLLYHSFVQNQQQLTDYDISKFNMQTKQSSHSQPNISNSPISAINFAMPPPQIPVKPTPQTYLVHVPPQTFQTPTYLHHPSQNPFLPQSVPNYITQTAHNYLNHPQIMQSYPQNFQRYSQNDSSYLQNTHRSVQNYPAQNMPPQNNPSQDGASQNAQYHNKVEQVHKKVPGRSDDLSMPRRVAPAQQAQSGCLHSSKTPSPIVSWPQTPSPTQQCKPASPQMYESALVKRGSIEDIYISRPSTPLTPSSAEVAKLYSQIGHETDTSSGSRNSGRCSTHSKSDLAESSVLLVEKLRETLSENSVDLSPASSESNKRKGSTASDEYVSAAENVEEASTEKMSLCLENIVIPPFVHCEKKTSETTPDSWEDIVPDDTPAKAENFFLDFTKPLDLILKDEYNSNVTLNTPMDVVSNTTEIKIKNQILPTKQLEPSINWKDVFDPDITNNTNRYNKRIINQKSPSLEKMNIRKVPVQKLEIKNKFFHLICVKNEPAVLVHEFYRQFTTLQSQVISKVLEVKYKPFTLINKTEVPEIFTELQKVEFCGGVDKKAVLKLGKASISYLSEIPEVFAALGISADKVLFDELKKISNEFKQC